MSEVAATNPYAWFPRPLTRRAPQHADPRTTAWSATRTRSTRCRSWTSTWPRPSSWPATRRPTSSASPPTAGCTSAAGATPPIPSTWPSTPTCRRRRRWRRPAPRRSGAAGRRHRRRRPPRPLLLLRQLGAPRLRRARHRPGRPARPHRHRRPAVLRRRRVDYLLHCIAAMVDVLRGDPGSLGLVSGVGMHMTKHVFGVYSTEPPASGRAAVPDQAGVQAGLDAAHPPTADRGPPRRDRHRRVATRSPTAATAAPSGASCWPTSPAAAPTPGWRTPTCWPRWRPRSGSAATVDARRGARGRQPRDGDLTATGT